MVDDLYTDASGLQALAENAPALFQSGNDGQVRTRTASVKPLRNVMDQCAWHMNDPWADTYYQPKRTEAKSHTMAL